MPCTQLLLPLGAVVGSLVPSVQKRLSSGSVHPPPVSQLSLVLPQPLPGNTEQETEEQQHFQDIFRQIAGDVSTPTPAPSATAHTAPVTSSSLSRGHLGGNGTCEQHRHPQVKSLSFGQRHPWGGSEASWLSFPLQSRQPRLQCPSSTEKPRAVTLTGTVRTGAAGIHFAKPLPSSSVLLNVTPLPSCSGHGDLCRRAQEYPELSCEQT